MATERIDIVIREDGSRVVKRNIEDIGGGAEKTNRAVDLLKQGLVAVGAAFAVQKLIGYSDALATIQGRLRLVTSGTEDLARTQDRLFAITQRTRSVYTGTVELYARLAKTTEELGVTQSTLLQVTESVNKALIVGGGSAESQNAALIQLGQGLGAGALRGAELNSVMEQAPRLAQAIADGLGVPIGKLKELGEAGELTSAKVVQALKNQKIALDTEFKQLPVTIGQSFTVLNNEVLKFVGTASNASGAAKAVSEAILLIARNIDLLTAAALGFATAKLAQIVIEIGTALVGTIARTFAYATALQTERAAAIGAAQAEVAKNTAQVASLATTQAAIVAARAEAVAALQLTLNRLNQAAATINATRANIGLAESSIAAATTAIAAAEATLVASSAAGALSFALATARAAEAALTLETGKLAVAQGVLTRETAKLAAAEAALTAANVARAGIIAELALLGRQQAGVTAAATAATVAQTAAQRGLTTAITATGVAARIGSSLLGLLGGPIGAIITVLGLGATAWALWGSSAKKAEQDATGEVRRSTEEIITALDKQIAKLKERNALASGGQAAIAKQGGDAADRLAELNAKINDFKAGTGQATGLNEVARQEILRVTLIQYAELAGKINAVGVEQAKLDAIGQKSKLADLMDKYADKALKLKNALADARKELGLAADAKLPPELDKLIRERFKETGTGNDKSKAIITEFQKVNLDLATFGQDEVFKQVEAFKALGASGGIVTQYRDNLLQIKALKAEEDVKKLIDAFKEEAATIGMSADQLAIRRLAVAGASAEQVRFAEALQDQSAATRNRLEVDKTIKALVEQRDALGQTTEQVVLNKLALQGATPEQLAYAKSILQGTKAIEDRIRAQKELDQLKERFKQQSGAGTLDLAKQEIRATDELVKDPKEQFGKTDQRGALIQQNQDLFAGSQEAMDVQIARFQNMYARIDLLRQADVITEEEAARARARVNIEEQQLRVQGVSSIFGVLAQLSSSGNRKLAAIGRAAAVTQATIDGVLAVQKALASSPPPLNYILAAAVGTVAAVNVAKILSTPAPGFKTGGYTGDGGTSDFAGFVHGREFVVNADATAKNRPMLEKMNKGLDTSSGKVSAVQPTQVNMKNINVLDPSLVEDFLSTEPGEQVFVNLIRKNSDAIRTIVAEA